MRSRLAIRRLRWRALREAEPELMRAAQKGVVHHHTASRKVSRLVHQVAKLPK